MTFSALGGGVGGGGCRSHSLGNFSTQNPLYVLKVPRHKISFPQNAAQKAVKVSEITMIYNKKIKNGGEILV